MTTPFHATCRSLLKQAILVVAAGFLLAASAGAERESSQSLIESGFILKIPLFIEWPKDHSVFNASSPIRIAILDEQEFFDDVNIILKNSAPGGRKTSAERLTDPSSISEYHEVFIGDSYCSNLPSILAALREIPTVTISRCDNFLQEGGMFRLYRDGTHVRIEMNKEALEATGLSADYRLSAMAKQARSKK